MSRVILYSSKSQEYALKSKKVKTFLFKVIHCLAHVPVGKNLGCLNLINGRFTPKNGTGQVRLM